LSLYNKQKVTNKNITLLIFWYVALTYSHSVTINKQISECK